MLVYPCHPRRNDSLGSAHRNRVVLRRCQKERFKRSFVPTAAPLHNTAGCNDLSLSQLCGCLRPTAGWPPLIDSTLSVSLPELSTTSTPTLTHETQRDKTVLIHNLDEAQDPDSPILCSRVTYGWNYSEWNADLLASSASAQHIVD